MSDPIEKVVDTIVDTAERTTEVVAAAVSHPIRTTKLVITAPIRITGGLLRGLFGI